MLNRHFIAGRTRGIVTLIALSVAGTMNAGCKSGNCAQVSEYAVPPAIPSGERATGGRPDAAADAALDANDGGAALDSGLDAALDAGLDSGDEADAADPATLAHWMTQDCKRSCAEIFVIMSKGSGLRGAPIITVDSEAAQVSRCAKPVLRKGTYFLHCESGGDSCGSSTDIPFPNGPLR